VPVVPKPDESYLLPEFCPKPLEPDEYSCVPVLPVEVVPVDEVVPDFDPYEDE